MKTIDKVKNIIEKNNGIVYTSELTKNNIPRQFLKELEQSNYIEKVVRGLYVKKGIQLNEFFVMQQKYKKGIYSHNTALYFYNLTDRTPLKLDLTFPSNIRLKNELLNVHYIQKSKYELGVAELQLNDGTAIKLYNMERTICDVIRDRNKIDSQIFNTALKEYVKHKDKNLIRLYKYAKEFNITEILKKYMEVLI